MRTRLSLIVCALLVTTPALAQQIQIRSAVYGENCGSSGDVTGAVVNACDGRFQCTYPIDHHVIGDPAPGCVKDFRVRWSCDGSHTRFRAVGGQNGGEASGQTIYLDCR
jgi:hypothetical protein